MPRLGASLASQNLRNLLPSNTNDGASLGIIGAGGSLPTGRALAGSINREVIDFGTIGGIPYFDVSISGNMTGGMFLNLCATDAMPAENQQTWITSIYFRVFGTPVNIGNIELVQSSRLANSGIKQAYPSSLIGKPSVLERFATTSQTLQNSDGAAGNVAFMLPYLRFSMLGDTEISFRVAGAQAELGLEATALQIV